LVSPSGIRFREKSFENNNKDPKNSFATSASSAGFYYFFTLFVAKALGAEFQNALL